MLFVLAQYCLCSAQQVQQRRLRQTVPLSFQSTQDSQPGHLAADRYLQAGVLVTLLVVRGRIAQQRQRVMDRQRESKAVRCLPVK